MRIAARTIELYKVLYDLHLAAHDVPLELHERVERLLKEAPIPIKELIKLES